MSFKEEILHPSRWVQDSEHAAVQLAQNAWEAVAANPGKTAAGVALVGAAIVLHKPVSAKVVELVEGLSGGTTKVVRSFEEMQEAAGETSQSFQLKTGANLVRIRSGGQLREYEALVPPRPEPLSQTAGPAEHKVVVAFDGMLLGGRKGNIAYANVSEAGLPPNGMPGNGFQRAGEENHFISVFPVPQKQGLFSGWGKVLKFTDDKRDVQFVQDILADLPKRASVELAPVQTADSLPLARAHLAGFSGGATFVREAISEGGLPKGTVDSAFMLSAPRFSSQAPIQAGIDILITHGQPRSIKGLWKLADAGVEGVSPRLLQSFPKELGRGDTLVRYEGGPGIEGKIGGALMRQTGSLKDSKPYLSFHDAASANGIDSSAVVPDTSNPFYIRRSAQSASGTKVEEILLAKPYDGHNFAGRPVITADGKAVSSRYRISDLHGPVIPPAQFSAIDRWLEFTGLKEAPLQ
jgi:hypothetical protein